MSGLAALSAQEVTEGDLLCLPGLEGARQRGAPGPARGEMAVATTLLVTHFNLDFLKLSQILLLAFLSFLI